MKNTPRIKTILITILLVSPEILKWYLTTHRSYIYSISFTAAIFNSSSLILYTLNYHIADLPSENKSKNGQHLI